MNRPVKLGDTVAVPSAAAFQPDTRGYICFDRDGRPCDEQGRPLWITQYRNVVLDTPEAVEYFNRTGKVLPDA